MRSTRTEFRLMYEPPGGGEPQIWFRFTSPELFQGKALDQLLEDAARTVRARRWGVEVAEVTEVITVPLRWMPARDGKEDGDEQSMMAGELYYGPADAENYCAYRYRHPGRRCPNQIDFYVKIPDGRGDDWRKARAACAEHLPVVIWQMQQDYGGYRGQYLLRASRDEIPL